MKEPTFYIFSGTPNHDDVWIEDVEGLSHARERMQEIAARNPGKYFLFCLESQSVLAQIQTFKKHAPPAAVYRSQRAD